MSRLWNEGANVSNVACDVVFLQRTCDVFIVEIHLTALFRVCLHFDVNVLTLSETFGNLCLNCGFVSPICMFLALLDLTLHVVTDAPMVFIRMINPSLLSALPLCAGLSKSLDIVQILRSREVFWKHFFNIHESVMKHSCFKSSCVDFGFGIGIKVVEWVHQRPTSKKSCLIPMSHVCVVSFTKSCQLSFIKS